MGVQNTGVDVSETGTELSGSVLPLSDLEQGAPGEGAFKYIAKVIPYFRNRRNVLIFKLDCLLLLWMFVAGLMKEMDQSATTQAYVSGMRESLGLYGNELVMFTTFFSIGYALGLVPGQLIQTRVSTRMPSGRNSACFLDDD